MLSFRSIPYKYRIEVINAGLYGVSRAKAIGWRKARDGDRFTPGPLIVSGFFDKSFGIARAGQSTLRALQLAGYELFHSNLKASLKDLIVGNSKLPTAAPGGVWLMHANAPEILQSLIAHAPDQWRDRYRIGYWAWETPKAPADWVWVAQYLHEIWVPSVFVEQALVRSFEAAGQPELSRRVRVVPHPILDIDSARPDRQRFGLRDDLTEFLCLFDAKSSLARKNPLGALRAWHRCFPAPSRDSRLTVKVQNLAYDPKIAKQLAGYLDGRDDIRVFTERLDNAGMNDFIASFDGMISLHRAEGFGLPLAEAMFLGVNVVATGWSGNLDFMDQTSSQLVPYRLIPIVDPSGVYEPAHGLKRPDPEQVWANPDLDAAAAAIRRLAADPAYRQQLADSARVGIQKVNDAWSLERLAGLPFNAFLAQSVRAST